MWAVSDLWMLTGTTTWLESLEELDRLLALHETGPSGKVKAVFEEVK
jgi:hypothetical protein